MIIMGRAFVCRLLTKLLDNTAHATRLHAHPPTQADLLAIEEQWKANFTEDDITKLLNAQEYAMLLRRYSGKPVCQFPGLCVDSASLCVCARARVCVCVRGCVLQCFTVRCVQ